MKVLETERMVLRRMGMSDVDGLMGIFSDPEAMRYYPGTKSRSEAEAWIQNQLDSDHGFALGHDRLVSLIDPGNLASRRITGKVHDAGEESRGVGQEDLRLPVKKPHARSLA